MTLPMLTAVGGFLMWVAATVLVSWLAFSLGRWLGTREAQRPNPEHESPVGSVVGATLALLAFTLAITFNMAHAKYNSRKELAREDAKAVRAVYDRAVLLPPEATRAAREKLAEYARLRSFDTFDADLPIGRILRRSEEIQQELWLEAVAHRDHPQARFYMDSLSTLTNTHAERVTMGVHDRVPLPVWISLVIVIMLGMLTMGYQSSLVGSRRNWAVIPLIIALCVVLCMAWDLDHPQKGILRVDQGPMSRLADAIATMPDGV